MAITRKLFSVVSVVLLAVLSLSACGDKDSAGDAPSSAVGGATTLTAANFAQALTDSQAKARSAHVTMAIGVAGQSIKATGDVAVGETPADSSLTMTMDMGSSIKLDMRLVDKVLYMNMGQMTQGKYLKIDLTDADNPFAKQYGQILDQMDPAKQMADLKDAVTSFEKKGAPQTIDGVEAQPYEVKVDTSKIKAFSDLPAEATAQFPKTLVYTLYVGSDKLMRRMEFEIAGSTSTIDYSKWGEPVDIKAPSADEVSDKDLGALMGSVPSV
ncbi:hypothetical protein GCM10022234_23590 [Aeromicrobium panaciterrae]|uniref:LppX_LprAFG lipoprotein n=1 Tax=Aeromicrobium panaciterrae TaxID=363861 RepID=UPI0031D00F2A